MKFKKSEIIWLVCSIGVYLFYNIPGIPAYHDFQGSLIHNCLGFGLIWVVNYIGFNRICKIYRAKKQKDRTGTTVTEAKKEETS